MSFADGNGLSAADIAAVVGNGGNGNGGLFGNNGNDSLTFIIILWLFAMMGGNGCFNGNVGNAAAIPAVQAGFDQAAVMNVINALSTQNANGFANAEVSRCNSQANILQTLNNMQANTANQYNQMAMALQNCCCENRAATADLKYTVATEACADRQAVSDGLRDIIANNTANTNALMVAIGQGFQGIHDEFCNARVENLQNQLDQANRRADIAQILAGQQQMADQIENRINPPAIPAFTVPNPYTSCGCSQYGGC